MGNLLSNDGHNVTSNVKNQAESIIELYELVSLDTDKGGGKLVELMKETNKTKNYIYLHEQIRTLVEPFLYKAKGGEPWEGEYYHCENVEWKHTILLPIRTFVEFRDKNKKHQKFETRFDVSKGELHKQYNI